MNRRTRKVGWMGWTLIALAMVALALFGAWRWAVAAGSAATLDWIDARFARDRRVVLAEAAQYGPDPAQRVELWVPAASSGGATPIHHPLVVFYHGGGWHSGAPEHYRFVARTMGEQGYATALVGYRLVPEGRFPAMLEDSAAALRWVVDNARSHAVGTQKIVLMGHSAGAYNALMLGLDPQWLAREGLPPDTIDGVISLAGPADFFPFDKDSSRNAFGHFDNPRATQPIAFARGDAPPVLLLHGTADDVVRPRNSRRLAAAVDQAGGRARLIEFDGMGHAGIIMALSEPFAQGGRVLDPIARFLRLAPAEASVPVQGEIG